MVTTASLVSPSEQVAFALDQIACFDYSGAAVMLERLGSAAPQAIETLALRAYLAHQLEGPEAVYRAASVALELTDQRAPAELAAAVLARDPAQPLALAVLAATREASGDRDAALALCAEGLRHAPEDYALNLQCALLEAGRDPAAARDRLRGLAQRHPRRAQPFYLLGKDAGLALAERVAALRRTAELTGEDGLAQYNCGTLLYQLGAHAEAVPVLRRALELQGGGNAVEHNLACALKQSGEFAAALEIWQAVLQREPSWTWVLASAADALARLGRHKEATAAWQRYAEVAEPGCEYFNEYLDHLWMYDLVEPMLQGAQARLQRVRDPVTLKYLGLAHSARGEHETALAVLQESHALQPGAGTLALIAKASNDLQRHALAEQIADEALAANPGSGQALCEKAVALFAQGRESEADALLTSYRGSLRFIARRCAEVMAAQRRFALAGRLYERQLEVTAEDARSASLAGDCYRDAGMRPQALALYQRAERLAVAEGWAELQAHARTQQAALAQRGALAGLLGWIARRR